MGMRYFHPYISLILFSGCCDVRLSSLLSAYWCTIYTHFIGIYDICLSVHVSAIPHPKMHRLNPQHSTIVGDHGETTVLSLALRSG